MNENRIKIKLCRTTGELEVEGVSSEVKEWWEKLWPEVSNLKQAPADVRQVQAPDRKEGVVPAIFGEYFTQFRSDITEVDRMLIVGRYAMENDPERVFTTKIANQLLLDQNIKLGNPSECVRRLIVSKKAFVVTNGKFRVSSAGLEHLNTLKSTSIN